MAAIGINLIKDRMASQRRRRSFWLMIAYLVVCSACLVLAANHATKNYISSRRRRGDVRRLEARFLSEHVGGETLTRYALRLKDEMDRIAVDLDTAGGLLDRRIRLATVLAGLALPLPAEVSIIDFSFDGGAHTAQFNLVTPASPRGDTVRATDLVAAWNRNPVLMSQIGSISPVGTQRDKVDGQPVILLKFEAGKDEEGG